MVMSAKAAVDHDALVILIAEDDPNDVLLLKRAFARAGIAASLFFVSNGQEVIHYLEAKPPYDNRAAYPYPSVLLLDVNMPRVNGLELLEWLAARPDRASLVAVMFSSCLAPGDCRQAAMLGAHCCITKPLDPNCLLPLLAKVSGQSFPDHAATDQENCAPQLRNSS